MTSPQRNLGPTISGLGGFTANNSNLSPATAFPLVSQYTSFSAVTAGAYAALPAANANELTVYDEDPSNALLVRPEPGDRIGTNGVDVPYSVAAGTGVKFATFDTPLTPKPRTWHVMALGSGGGGGGNIGTITAGANITVTNGTGPNTTIAATGTTGVTSVIAQGGPFLANGTITGAGTISNSAASLTAHGIILAEGTGAAVATAAMTNGQLLIGATGADPVPQTMSGDATINAGGTIAVSKVAGNTLSANQGAVLNSGTVSINNAITLAGTAAGTLTPSPTTGTTDVIINMPAAGGTVTVNGVPSFSRQRMLMEIKQGATAGILNLGTVYKFTGAVTSFTLTATANAVDRLQFLSPDGTSWVSLAIDQNATL